MATVFLTQRREQREPPQSPVYSKEPMTLVCSPRDHNSSRRLQNRQITFSDLPQDLVRLIFEQTAMMSPKAAVALNLVSRRVRAWVEHLLYHTVVLWTSRSVELFRIPFDSKPKSFFAQHVQNLFINGKYGMDIILACTNVKRLAAYPLSLIPLSDSPAPHSFLNHPTQSNAAFRHYPTEIMLLGYLEDVPWSSPLFNHVKYLYFGIERPASETATYIARLPCLTHCAFPYDGDERSDDSLILTISVLLESQSLAYLIVLINEEQEGCNHNKKSSIWKQLGRIRDRRLLVGTERCFDGNDWFEAVNNAVDLWGSWVSEYKSWRYLG